MYLEARNRARETLSWMRRSVGRLPTMWEPMQLLLREKERTRTPQKVKARRRAQARAHLKANYTDAGRPNGDACKKYHPRVMG
eukprot:878712-Amphidinium_carterae.1